MAAYFVVSYRITNPVGYEPYVPAVIPTLLAHGCDILVADYETEVVEGEADHVTVVLKFPTREAAREWYNSAEYQAVKHHRTDNTEGTAVLVDGWVPPK